jgi:hypothetical protein
MPRPASGSVTRSAVQSSVWPRVREASRSVRSTASIAARLVLTMNGSATTNDATTAACQVNIRLKPVQR